MKSSPHIDCSELSPEDITRVVTEVNLCTFHPFGTEVVNQWEFYLQFHDARAVRIDLRHAQHPRDEARVYIASKNYPRNPNALVTEGFATRNSPTVEKFVDLLISQRLVRYMFIFGFGLRSWMGTVLLYFECAGFIEAGSTEKGGSVLGFFYEKAKAAPKKIIDGWFY